MKRKIYVAKRIPKHTLPEEVLGVTSDMTVSQVSDLYAAHEIDYGSYIYNGHWTLRGNTPVNNMPPTIAPYDIFLMCANKINSSDAIVACVGLETYGTIAEAAYAIGLQNKAVYVLPEDNSEKLLKEAWFIMTMSLNTKSWWREEDILNLSLFQDRGIRTLEEYEQFVRSLIPPFLKQ